MNGSPTTAAKSLRPRSPDRAHAAHFVYTSHHTISPLRFPMNRRQWLTRSAVAAPIGLPWLFSDQRAAAAPTDKLATLKITEVKTFLTAPANIRLVVVKVQTSEPGLY